MSDQRGLPIVCARCANLLMQGTTTCRTCGWDAVAAAAPAPAPLGNAGPPQSAPLPSLHPRRHAPLGLGQAAMVLVAITCVVDVVAVLLHALTAMTYHSAHDMGSAELALTTEGLYAIVAIINALLLLAAGIVVICWSVSSRDDAAALGTVAQRHSRRWAIAGWLVPIVSLVYPFEVVSDVWKANDPLHGRTSRGVIAVWWITWLVGGFLSYVTLRTTTTHDGTTTSSSSFGRSAAAASVSPLEWLGVACVVVAGIAFVHMVRTIRDWQQRSPASQPGDLQAV